MTHKINPRLHFITFSVLSTLSFITLLADTVIVTSIALVLIITVSAFMMSLNYKTVYKKFTYSYDYNETLKCKWLHFTTHVL